LDVATYVVIGGWWILVPLDGLKLFEINQVFIFLEWDMTGSNFKNSSMRK
jgi:hypothetical protein